MYTSDCYVSVTPGGLGRLCRIQKSVHLGLLALALCFTWSVFADDYYWVSTSDGAWIDPNNWSSSSPGTYPDQNGAGIDRVFFQDLSATTQVTVDLAGANYSIGFLDFNNDSTIYNIKNSDNAGALPSAYETLDVTWLIYKQGSAKVNVSDTKLSANYFTNVVGSFNFVADNVVTILTGAGVVGGGTVCFDAGPGFSFSSPSFSVFNNGTLKINTSSGATFSASIINVASVINSGCSPGTAYIQGNLFYQPTGRSDFELDMPNVIASGSDYFSVNGNLTIDGTINIINLPNFGEGSYRLFDYTGVLVNNGVHLGMVPTGFVARLDFSTPNQVNLVVLTPALLHIALDHGNAILSWTNAGYRLESTPLLGTGAVWTVLPGSSPVTVTITNSTQFFRLISP
jgi:hypothetical protein